MVLKVATSCDLSERIITRAICQGPRRFQIPPPSKVQTNPVPKPTKTRTSSLSSGSYNILMFLLSSINILLKSSRDIILDISTRL